MSHKQQLAPSLFFSKCRRRKGRGQEGQEDQGQDQEDQEGQGKEEETGKAERKQAARQDFGKD